MQQGCLLALCVQTVAHPLSQKCDLVEGELLSTCLTGLAVLADTFYVLLTCSTCWNLLQVPCCWSVSASDKQRIRSSELAEVS